jgi:hypothetical protein
VAENDRDHLFWKGLPKDLQCDIFGVLRGDDDARDWHKAPAISQVYDIVTKKFLEKDSIFAPFMASQRKSKSKKAKNNLSKKKKKLEDLFSDDSADKSSDSEDEKHHKSKKHSSKQRKHR